MIEENLIFDGYEEQDRSCYCPNCGYNLQVMDILGFGNYPIGGFRNLLHPNSIEAMGFECPLCFVKSVCHCDINIWKELIKDYEECGLLKK